MGNPTFFKFRLYVAADAANSVQAITNLQALCRTHLPGRHKIEIVDVFKEPLLALEASVYMTPTLIKMSPAPERRIVGALRQTHALLQSLGLEPIAR